MQLAHICSLISPRFLANKQRRPTRGLPSLPCSLSCRSAITDVDRAELAFAENNSGCTGITGIKDAFHAQRATAEVRVSSFYIPFIEAILVRDLNVAAIVI